MILFLADVIPFSLLERLNQRPGAFGSYNSLIDDVWNNVDTENSAVQKQANNLKVKLKKAFGAGIEIKGEKAHYAIFVSCHNCDAVLFSTASAY